MKAIKRATFFLLLAWFLSPGLLPAAYNPAKDNPYVKPADSAQKKWYEFYKKENPSAYTRKPYGYWRSTKEENIFVRGAKTVFEAARQIVAAGLE